jgi:hypothetical protein
MKLPHNGTFRTPSREEAFKAFTARWGTDGFFTTKTNAGSSRRQNLINCLKDGVEVGDWHLVSDLANDLRVLEAKEGV